MYIQLTLTELELLLPNSRELLLTGGGLFWILKIINPITNCHSQFLQWYSKVAQLSCDIIDKFRKMKCNTKKNKCEFFNAGKVFISFSSSCRIIFAKLRLNILLQSYTHVCCEKMCTKWGGGWHLHVNEYLFFSVWLNY